jgi:23S rRNA pseudouridine2605 synthase
MRSAKPNKKRPFVNKPVENSSIRPSENSIRLNRFIANAGICSRREADELIKAGKIELNGKVVTEMGSQVRPLDIVTYEGKALKSEKLAYVLLNKPKDFITTVSDEKGRKTVMELVRSAGNERIVPVGRLDKNTTGLLLFTNDGDLTKKLTHPSYQVRKLYHVTADKNISDEDLEKLAEGFELEDGFIKADEVSRIIKAGKNEIGILLHSGRNRIVRRMMEHLGYRVMKLDRVVFANLTKKDLPRGKWRKLSQDEIDLLKRMFGNK